MEYEIIKLIEAADQIWSSIRNFENVKNEALNRLILAEASVDSNPEWYDNDETRQLVKGKLHYYQKYLNVILQSNDPTILYEKLDELCHELNQLKTLSY